MNDFSKIFNGAKVLITGHTGFKGAWLTLWLKNFGAKITGLSLSIPTKPSLFEIFELGEQVDDFRFDI